jgi:transcriptional regulator with XRE-family HTH domain
MKHWPTIIEFLGRDPTPEPRTLGERLLAYRRRCGLNRKALATALAVDEATLWTWENDMRMPEKQRHISAIRQLELPVPSDKIRTLE